ncbi:MAG: DUF433 domain-containing protein [Gemmatimonadetes bacterium]|nr:DUF433 domain-containing protein [Gemmatimonadota bacterium]
MDEATVKISNVVTIDPEIMGGTPVFTGTRVPVGSLMRHLRAGDTVEDFLDGFPTVRRERANAFLEMVLHPVQANMRVLLN